MNGICPWCQTEIVWDEDIGPENVCPHCMNELSAYRTVRIDYDSQAEVNSTGLGSRAPKTNERKPDDLLEFEEAVESYLDQQDEAVECPYCQEYMVLAGEQRIDKGTFVPAKRDGLKPFIEAPFSIQMFVCPDCFHVSQMLCEDARLKVLTLPTN